MKPSSLCLLLAMPALFSLAAASVEDVCRAAASSSPNINYDFCVASLRRDSRSGSADEKTLATIAASLASASASSTASKINALLGGGRDARAKEALETCRSIYGDQTANLAEAISAIGSGDAGTAMTRLSAAVDAPGECENGFRELGVASPLTKENDEEEKLATIALAITNML